MSERECGECEHPAHSTDQCWVNYGCVLPDCPGCDRCDRRCPCLGEVLLLDDLDLAVCDRLAGHVRSTGWYPALTGIYAWCGLVPPPPPADPIWESLMRTLWPDPIAAAERAGRRAHNDTIADQFYNPRRDHRGEPDLAARILGALS